MGLAVTFSAYIPRDAEKKYIAREKKTTSDKMPALILFSVTLSNQIIPFLVLRMCFLILYCSGRFPTGAAAAVLLLLLCSSKPYFFFLYRRSFRLFRRGNGKENKLLRLSFTEKNVDSVSPMYKINSFEACRITTGYVIHVSVKVSN